MDKSRSSYIIICNWKMYLPHNQAVDWVKKYAPELNNIVQTGDTALAICPSFDALQSIKQELKNTLISLCAQDCAPQEHGPLTGQVSALSLKEIGCAFCIVGHSETRLYQGVSDEEVAQKVITLLQNDITPIICVGETEGSYQQGHAETILRDQLKPIAKELQKTPFFKKHIYIAYEPIWSIGSGKTPDNSYLESIFAFIADYMQKHDIADTIHYLYGGSVNAKSIKMLKNIPNIQGFLIGSASIDFQELKNIVLYK